jgi:hypothetical protein
METSAYTGALLRNDTNSSGVSWGAVIAGAFAAAALSLILLALGTGIGFSAVSPWGNSAASPSAIGWTAVLWLVLMQLIASSMGGYLAGRLRTKWVSVHTHEVYFRDTAHGFLAWAVGLVIAAAFLASAATSLAGGAARRNEIESNGPGSNSPNEYFVEELLRQSSVGSGQDLTSLDREVGLIFVHATAQGGISPADKSYVAQIVAARTGVSEPDAEKRVDDVFTQAQQAADAARKALAHAMYWTFLALLVGAFCASLAATIGGKQRDRVAVI